VSRGWVCLMYHQVAGEEPGGSVEEYFGVSRGTFARHLDAIAAAGWRGCSVAEAVQGPGGRRVAITFDDGTVGHYAHAFPELVRRGMAATFFVTTTWVGRPGYVTWEQLREMRAAGMEIGSHTRTHPFLSELDAGELERELAGAREEIDAALGQRTVALALPGGDAPRRALRPLLGASGYRIVATSRWGANPDAAAQPVAWVRRSTVRGAADAAEFARILEANPALTARRRLRESVLGSLRRVLGPSRYARWRRSFLGARGPSGRETAAAG
jgi:peptidoglycan/xylan/chitin deacetylase (PgdA/CDA1 family)